MSNPDNTNEFDSYHDDSVYGDQYKDHPHLPSPLPERQLALVKHGHRYVFHYSPGQEPELIERLANLARDSSCSLGMFDAAVLSHQVGRRLSQQVEKLLKC